MFPPQVELARLLNVPILLMALISNLSDVRSKEVFHQVGRLSSGMKGRA